MKTLRIYNSGGSIAVELKVDLMDNEGQNFTIMDTSGLTDEAIEAGLDIRLLPSSIGEMTALAEDLGFGLSEIDIDPSVGETVLVNPA